MFHLTIGSDDVYSRTEEKLLEFIRGCRLEDEFGTDDISICAGFCADRAGNVYENERDRRRGTEHAIGHLL